MGNAMKAMAIGDQVAVGGAPDAGAGGEIGVRPVVPDVADLEESGYADAAVEGRWRENGHSAHLAARRLYL
jgi:hypothetical protein